MVLNDRKCFAGRHKGRAQRAQQAALYLFIWAIRLVLEQQLDTLQGMSRARRDSDKNNPQLTSGKH
jgi:hypothetical protein